MHIILTLQQNLKSDNNKSIIIIIWYRWRFFLPSNTSAIMGTVSQDMQGTVGATQRMVQNIGIAFYTAVTSLFINHSSNSDKLLEGSSHAWLFASLTLFLALLPFSVKLLKHKFFEEKYDSK